MILSIALILCCLQVIECNGVKSLKHGCYEEYTINKDKMLLGWRSQIDWNPEGFKSFIDKLVSTCGEEAKKVNAGGFALFWWGQCFPVSPDELSALDNDDKSDSCYLGDGSYGNCGSDSGLTNCVGDDSSVYVYSITPVDGGLGVWSTWSQCSSECNGQRQRSRECNNPPPTLGGAICLDVRMEQEPCNTFVQCPVDGGWSDWGEWRHCPPCGLKPGSTKRSRECNNPEPIGMGKRCDGSEKETKACPAVTPCPVDGGFGAWGSWSKCSLTCGAAMSYRRRKCDTPPPSHGGYACDGDTEQTRGCNTKPCHSNGGFSKWSSWSACSVSCGGGERKRSQSCEVTSLCQKETRDDVQPCGTKPCPIDGHYGLWAGWSQCSKRCGSGTRQRTRPCNNPQVQFGGKDCAGAHLESSTCNSKPCPINGGWSHWTRWSHCSKRCSYGVRKRYRVCNRPRPQNGGRNCVGSRQGVIKCHMKRCYSPFTAWSGWSKCSSKCGRGRQKSFRKCKRTRRRCRAKTMKQRTCHNKCPDPYPNCKLSHTRKYFEKAILVKRGQSSPHVIPKLGKQYKVSFAFVFHSMKEGGVIHVRGKRINKQKMGRRQPLVQLLSNHRLKVELPANGRHNAPFVFPQQMAINKRYTLSISQVIKGKDFILTVTLSGQGVNKSFTVKNKTPTFAYGVRVHAVTGWLRRANTSVQNLIISGICTR